MVIAKSGATLKQIVNDCLPIITDFTPNDYIILLAGTNDVDGKSPSYNPDILRSPMMGKPEF